MACRIVLEGTTAHVYDCTVSERNGTPVFVFEWAELAPLLAEAELFVVHAPDGVYHIPRPRLIRRGQRVTTPIDDWFYVPISVCAREQDTTRETTIPDTA